MSEKKITIKNVEQKNMAKRTATMNDNNYFLTSFLRNYKTGKVSCTFIKGASQTI